MKPLKTLLLLMVLAITLETYAQDPHFSHIHASPLNNNPAWTGVFNDNFRLIANYRNQWKSPTANFNTFAVSLDMRHILGRSKVSINGGVSFLSDKGGDLGYGTNTYSFLGGLTVPLDRKGRHFVTTGMSAAFIRHHIDISNMQAIDEEPLIYSFDLQKGGVDLSAGIGYFMSLDERKNFYAGFSAYHINQPDIGIVQDVEVPLYKRYVANAGAGWEFRKVGIMPSAILYWQGPHREVNAGSYFSVLVRDPGFGAVRSSEMRLYAGVWFRYYIHSTYNSGFDALIFSARFDVERFILGFSFDVTLSELVEATTVISSPEISMIYTFSPRNGSGNSKGAMRKNKQRIQCPAF